MASGRIYSYQGKKKTTWRVRVDRGTDPDTGKAAYDPLKSFDTEAAAKRYLRNRLYEIDHAIPASHEKMTLAELLTEWLEQDAPATTQDTTLEHYEATVANHIIPRIGARRIAVVSPASLQRYFADLAHDGVGTRTIQLCRARLRQAFAYAERMNYVPRNPVTATRPPRAERAPLAVWSIADVKRFLSVAEQDVWWPIWLLAITTGLRRGELLGLRWRDVSLEAGTASIRQSVVWLRGAPHIHGTKTGAPHQVALDSECVSALTAHRARQNGVRLRQGAYWRDHDLIFTTGAGTPISPRNLYRQFLRLIEDAGVPRIKLHGLRGTSASLMLGLGVHPKIASDRLGHSTIKLTMDTYSFVSSDLQRDAAEAIRKAVREGS